MLKLKNTSLPVSYDQASANTAVTNNKYLSLPRLRNTQHQQKNITKKKIEEIAIQKYKTSGHGINYIDVMEDFHIKKGQA